MRSKGFAYVCINLALSAAEVPCAAALDAFPDGARSASLGGASVTIADPSAIYNNQAALGRVRTASAMVNYQNKYLLSGLHMAAAAFVMPVPYAGTAGVSICAFGNAAYSEARMGLGIGRELGGRFAIGAQINYTRLSVEGYGGAGAISAEAGVLMQPAENLLLGAHIYNFTYSKLLSKTHNESLPVVFNLGVGYKLLENTGIFVQSSFYSGQSMVFCMGAEYKALEVLALRIGAALKPMQVFAGVGYTASGLTIDFAAAHHPALGYSPQVSLIYSFGK